LKFGFVGLAGFIIGPHRIGGQACEHAGLAKAHLHAINKIEIHQRWQPVFPGFLPDGGDTALREIKAFVNRDPEGIRLGAEVGVKGAAQTRGQGNPAMERLLQ
jgi:hypothetical protein